MTKFEQVGINNMMSTTNKLELQKGFNWSCHCCCTKGLRISCSRCAIAYNYNLLMAYFADKERPNNTKLLEG
jgi:hypothetical protein